MKTCACGCGEIVARTFVRGHHLRVSEYKRRLYTPERNAKISAAHADGRIPDLVQPSGPDHYRWVPNEELGYTGLHDRLAAVRGSARRYECRECERPAVEWALNHAHPGLTTVLHMGRETPIAADLDAYFPLCVSCHRKADLNGGYRCRTPS